MADSKFARQIPTNVISLESSRCACNGCKAKATQADFCAEHFGWFKAGLIRKDGSESPDFDKKFSHYKSKKVA